MCCYCVIGDHFFKYDPPFEYRSPLIPMPIVPGPFTPWPIDRLHELEDMMRRVKDLEDRLGCPCEPNKADYLGMLRERIEALERAAVAGPR